MVRVVYICERCEKHYGKPQATKEKSHAGPPTTPCEFCGYTGQKHKRVIATNE